MEEQGQAVCPWCQTEIVWDPEIGPEETCPHCFNELGNYRSLNLQLAGEDEAEDFLQDIDEEEDDNWTDEWNDYDDQYGNMVQECLDTQEETPHCSNCQELMLLAGERKVSNQDFAAHIPEALGEAFLVAPFAMKVYICPSCFRIEHALSDSARLAMIERLSKQNSAG